MCLEPEQAAELSQEQLADILDAIEADSKEELEYAF